MLTNEIDNLIPLDYESENKEYRDVCLSGLDKSEETVIVGPEGAGVEVVYKMLSDYYGERALCLASSSLSAKQVETTTLFEMVVDDYDDYAMQALERELKGKEIVMIFATECFGLEALRFIFSAVDAVNIKYDKQVKLAFFLGAENPDNVMVLEYIKAFAHRPVHVFDLLQCKQACEAKAEAC